MDKRRLIVYALICLLLGGLATYGVVVLTSEKKPVSFKGQSAERTPLDKKEVYLYFGSATDTCLVAEKRTVHGGDPTRLSRNIIDTLISGPVRTDRGTAYVDFTVDIRDRHPGGSEAELLAIYSIVNSLVLNVDEVKKVKILIEGREADTLAGHIDLRFPFDANMRMVR